VQGLWLWLLFGFGSLCGRYPWITLPKLDGVIQWDSMGWDGLDWTGLDWNELTMRLFSSFAGTVVAIVDCGYLTQDATSHSKCHSQSSSLLFYALQVCAMLYRV
jgi:hypothetical protein